MEWADGQGEIDKTVWLIKVRKENSSVVAFSGLAGMQLTYGNELKHLYRQGALQCIKRKTHKKKWPTKKKNNF